LLSVGDSDAKVQAARPARSAAYARSQTKAEVGARIGRQLLRASSIGLDPRLTLPVPRGKS
jgi:hypothetical protein